MTYNVVKVARAPVMVCLQCPLCCNLVHEATTISECLHTFCRDCIYQSLGDGETDSCPICNVSLGCSPLEKLRADHQLDDVRAKIFPSKSKKRKAIEGNIDAPPVRRKERSLSSLGIGAVPPSANPGFVSRRTKSLSRRSVTIRDTSADEFEDQKTDRTSEELKDFEAEKDQSDTLNSTGALLEADFSDVKIAPVSEDRREIFHHGKKDFFPDGKRETNEEESSHAQKGELLVASRRTPLPRKFSYELPLGSSEFPVSGNDSLSNLGLYLAERSKLSATGLLRSPSPEVSEQPIRLSAKEEVDPWGSNDLMPPAIILENRERSGKGSKSLSTLAHLAEVAVDHADVVEHFQQRRTARGARAHATRSRRERGKSLLGKGALGGESFVLHSTDENIPASASQLQSRLPPLGRSSTGLDKLPVVRNKSSNGGIPANAASVAKRDKSHVGLWFALRAAENQVGDNALPQISTRYLRIKDGKLPVSIVKKYLVKKLDLRSESEVEITCRGQPVVPSLPLESIQGIWFATTSPSDLLPSLKEMDGSSNDATRWAPIPGTSAEGYMMVLTYGRNRRKNY